MTVSLLTKLSAADPVGTSSLAGLFRLALYPAYLSQSETAIYGIDHFPLLRKFKVQKVCISNRNKVHKIFQFVNFSIELRSALEFRNRVDCAETIE